MLFKKELNTRYLLKPLALLLCEKSDRITKLEIVFDLIMFLIAIEEPNRTRFIFLGFGNRLVS